MQSSSPEVSVIIPAAGASHHLHRQLQALAGQVDAPEFEVIISDNGVTAALDGILAPWESRLDLRVVDSSAKRGASFARNFAVSLARGERLLFCDYDDIVATNWVYEMSRADLLLDGVATCCPLIIFDTEQELPVGDIETSALLNDHRYQVVGRDGFHLFGMQVFGGCSFGMTAADYRRLGGMDQSFPHGAEDTDLAFRHSESGGVVVTQVSTHIYYRQPVGKAGLLKKRYGYGKGDMQLARRRLERCGAPTLPVYRWTHTLESAIPLLRFRGGGRAGRAAQLLGQFVARTKIRVLHILAPAELFPYEEWQADGRF